jgi:hypothetical protein
MKRKKDKEEEKTGKVDMEEQKKKEVAQNNKDKEEAQGITEVVKTLW